MSTADAIIDQIHYLADRALYLRDLGHYGDAQAVIEDAEDLAHALRKAEAVYLQPVLQ